MTRRLCMTFSVATRMLEVNPDDSETREWLRTMSLDLFAEICELGKSLQSLDTALRTDEPPRLKAAEYQSKLEALFPNETIEIRAVLG